MVLTHGNIIYLTSLNPQLSKNIAYVGSFGHFSVQFFLLVFCNSTANFLLLVFCNSTANSSDNSIEKCEKVR